MGLALGLCLVSGASAVLMVSVPAPPAELGPSEEAAESLPVGGDGDGSASDRRTAPDDAVSSSASGRGQEPSSPDPGPAPAPSAPEEEDGGDEEAEEEVPVLLRSVEEEVDSADGDMAVVEGESDVMGEGPLTTFTVEVEEGLPGEAEDFAAAVEQVLGDPRSWGNDGERSMQRVDGDDADVRVLLAAPDTVDRLCAPLNTNGYVSCANGNRAIINQNRWVAAVEDFEDDLETYRIYVINHEVGHTLGHGHVDCPGEGELAPVMQQQTLSLQGCEANGWVHPENDPED
ncbi:DUF3152 domain-containing protein [Nocardiopsis aegyptia]|uniref:DUF3152 domain-containing protein n=1 Tax=Nocardiopsis aegyptia TaxID=220378 RepID=UPI00366DE245